MRSYSIKNYLFLYVLAVSLPILILLGFSMQSSYSRLLEDSLMDTERFTQLISIRIHQNIDDSKIFLGGLAKRPGIKRLDTNGCDPILQDLKQFFKQYANLAVLDKDGKMVCSALRTASGNMPSFSEAKWFIGAKKTNGFHVGEIHKGPVSGKWVTVISMAIKNEEGSFNGLIGYSLDLESYNPLPPDLRMPEGTKISILDSENKIVVNLIGKNGPLGSIYPDIENAKKASARPGFAIIAKSHDDEEVVVVSHIEDAGWTIISSVKGIFLLELKKNYFLTWGLTAACVIIAGFLITIIIGRRITTPVMDISAVASKVASGDLSIRAGERGPSEIRQVALEFNRMLDIRLKTENRYRNLLNYASDGIIVVNEASLIIMCNPKTEEIFGYGLNELNGKDISVLIPEDLREIHKIHVKKFFSDWENIRIKSLEIKGLHSSGNILFCELTIKAFKEDDDILVLVIVRDITEKKKAEAEKAKLEMQLIQTQKVESIGRLAGGVAHDLNNMLSPVIGYSEMLLNEMPEGHPFRQGVLHIEEAGERCRDLVGQLLAFARKQTLEMKPLNLNQIIMSFKQMLARTLRENIDIETILSPDLFLFTGDKAQIEQIILNLSINAQDAMPEGGTLTMETSNTSLDDFSSRAFDGSIPGEYIMLSISDTGSGMDKELQSQIFEPFFTTKGLGHGTGLGLSTVHGIVKQHGGQISVYSEKGKGTIFKLLFPARKDIENFSPDLKKIETKPDSGGNETILVVEDQPNVRIMVAESLRKLGYNIIEAIDGNTAARLAEEFDGEINLLLTDVILTDINGKTVYEMITQHRKNLKAIFMSGYTADVIGNKGILETGINFIQKPFSLNALAKKIREVIEMDKEASKQE